MYLAFLIISTLCAINLSNGLSTKDQLVKYANTVVDITLKDLVNHNVMPLPDVEAVVEDSIGSLKFNTTVNLKNGKLIGLKSAKRVGDCEVLSSNRILCPVSAADIVASYENHAPVSGVVKFAVIITLDDNEHIVKVETTEPVFLENDVQQLYSILSKVGKSVKKQVKQHAGQIVGKVVGIVVKAGVTRVTGSPVLGQVAGNLVGKVVEKQVDKKVNHH